MITNEHNEQVHIVAHVMEYGSAPDGHDDKRWVIARKSDGSTALYGIWQLKHSDGHVALMEALIANSWERANNEARRFSGK
jgi:hypothetical protein